MSLIKFSYSLYLQLKVYAVTQRRRTHWHAADSKYKGYSCEFHSSMQSLLISIAVLTAALTYHSTHKGTTKILPYSGITC